MSLINEALKKAQRQRSLDAAPLSHAPSGVAAAAVTTHVRAASHKRSLAPLWFGFGLVALGGVAAFLVMRYGIADANPAAVAASTPVAATPAVAPAPTPVVAVVPSPAPAPAVSVQLPVAVPRELLTNPPAPAPAPVAPVAVVTFTPAAPVAEVPAERPAAPVASAPTAAAPAPAPVAVAPVVLPPPATEAEHVARVYAFLSSIRLTGVRGADAQARVLMNEKVFRLNDTVDAALGLRLSAVRPNLLVFTDARGRTFEKTY